MTSVSKTGRLAALLREHAQTLKGLEGRSKDKLAGSTGTPTPKRKDSADIKSAVVDRVAALRESGVLEESVLRRAAIEEMLISRFPRGIVNDASFQQVVDNVAAAISEDAELVEAYREFVTGR
jgi:hypothetical protein